ncbi:hypothetical protein BayCH28_17195 [Mycolicibacterium sp. CH28]|nr:hypothetical protein BayCH28_17195 [Mycolicibacterium sp. CH28]
MWRTSAVVAIAVALSALFGAPAPAKADEPVPAAGGPCPADFDNVMTQLPGGRDYLVCLAGPGGAAVWAPVETPFPPNSRWLSYGPAITLHGQGFRNPNLRSGQWTATPLGPDTVCGAEQVAVVAAGVLAPPEVSQGQPGQPLAFGVLPKLFTVVLSGNCLWSEDQPPLLGW